MELGPRGLAGGRAAPTPGRPEARTLAHGGAVACGVAALGLLLPRSRRALFPRMELLAGLPAAERPPKNASVFLSAVRLRSQGYIA